MGFIDIIILLVIAAGIITGILSGFARQIASLAAIFIGVVVTRAFGTEFTGIVTAAVPELASRDGVAASVIAHIVLFCFVYLSVRLLGYLLKSIISSLRLGFFDKIGGMIFCPFKYLLVLSIVLNIWLVISPGSPLVSTSKLLDGKVCEFTVNLLPKLLDSDLIPNAAKAVESML